MLKLNKALTLLLIVFTLQSCHQPKTVFNEEKPVIVAGKIDGYNANEHKQTIILVRRDFFELNEKMVSEIDSLGNFYFKYPSYLSQEIYLIYNNLVNLAVSPGDSLFLEIDVDYLKEKNPNLLTFCKTEEGRTNYLLNQLKQVIRKSSFFYDSQGAMKEKSPTDFQQFEKEKYAGYSAIVDSFISKNETTANFKLVANDFLKYHIWEDHLRYRWYHPYLNEMPKDSLILPSNFYDFLQNYDMNEAEYFSVSHSDFLDELSAYSTEHPKDSILRAHQLYKENKPVEAYKALLGMIDCNTSGLTNEIVYVKSMMQILNGQMLDLFESVFDSSRVLQPVFKKIIREKHQELVKFTNNVDTGAAKLTSIASTEVATFMTDLVAKDKGKVIYVDFWAPWCGPCMNEMAYSKELQEYYKQKDVVFLFFANRCSNDSWKSTITNNQFTGEHILLTNKQFDVLSAFFNFSGIPHYVVIDKNGNIVMKDAPAPSAKNEIIKTIDQYLNK